MTDYVVGFLREALTDRVILVRKNRPTWQVGLLNGPGGKIETVRHNYVGEVGALKSEQINNETPIHAMCREWREEIGFEHSDWRHFCTLKDDRDISPGATVHFFSGTIRFFPDLPKTNDVGEAIETLRISHIPFRRDLLSNLKWLIPLAFEDVDAPFMINGQAA